MANDIDELHNIIAIYQVRLHRQLKKSIKSQVGIATIIPQRSTGPFPRSLKQEILKSEMRQRRRRTIAAPHRPHKEMRCVQNSVNSKHQQMEKKKNIRQNMLSTESSTAKSTASARCIVCNGIATVSVETHGRRQNTFHNSFLLATSSTRAIKKDGKAGDEKNLS